MRLVLVFTDQMEVFSNHSYIKEILKSFYIYWEFMLSHKWSEIHFPSAPHVCYYVQISLHLVKLAPFKKGSGVIGPNWAMETCNECFWVH